MRDDPPQPAAARDLLETALEFLDSYGSVVESAYSRVSLARAELMLENYDDAIAQAQRGIDALGTDHRLETARAQLVLAAAWARQGRHELAKEQYELAALHLESSRASRQAASVWAELAELLEAEGDQTRALHAYRESLRRLGVQPSLGHALADAGPDKH